MGAMHKQLRLLVGVLFMLALLPAGSVHGAPSGNIIYVRHDAVGNNDGSSWADAYTDLQDALGRARGGDEIWVAQGVYYPAPNAIDRTATFELVDGVGLYGGFAGSEAERDERDWEANVTVLSGDLDRNDITDNGVVTDATNITGDNAYHVVTGGGATETAVLDGLTITAGQADGSHPHNHGGGMHNYVSRPTLTNVTFSGNQARYGGGMYNYLSSPTLINVTFSGNSADDAGGGMYNSASSLELTNVTFSGNSADDTGGGMINLTSSLELTDVTFSGNQARWGGGMFNLISSPTLTNVRFIANSADLWGGGMRNADGSDPTLTNVTFTGNQSNLDGGGMSNYDNSNPTLTNVIFSGNYAGQVGGGMDNTYNSNPTLTNVTFSGNSAGLLGGGISNWNSNPTLTNCILWGNTASQQGPEIYNTNESTPTISYSDIEGSGGSTSWNPDLGIDLGNNIDDDPLFVDPVPAANAPTTAGDCRLRLGSPAIDVGNSGAVPTGVTTDLDGNPRIVDGTGDGAAVVDMGAYEFQILFAKIYLPLVLANH